MKTPTLPPKYINVPAAIAYQRDLPATVILTYVQLRGLAWNTKGTLEIDWIDLLKILGKPRTTIYRHLAQLESCGWLRFNSTHQRTMVVYFSGPGETPESSHLTSPLNEDDLKELGSDKHPPIVDFKSGGIVPSVKQSSQKWDKDNGWHEVIDDDLADLLDRVGVYKDKFRDVAAAGWTAEQLETLAESVLNDLGPGNGGGVFLYRLKNTQPPKTEDEQRAAYVDDLRKFGLISG